jgi:zinc transport system substrate-binding protein
VTWLAALFWLGAAVGAATPAPAVAEAMPVLVSVLPQKYLVEQVGGDRVRTAVLVGAGQDPHTYDPTPRQMAEVAGARVYFRVGIDFEDAWLGRLLGTNPGLRVVDQRQGIPLRTLDDHGHSGADGHHDHHHAGRPDPHIWTSPGLAKRMAAQIRDELGRLDPEGAAAFAAGYARLATDLDALDAQIRATLAAASGRRFMVFHPSWGYFADAYGLDQIAIELGGKEPGARALARLIERARAARIGVIFVEPQDSPAPAQAVARAVGAAVVTVDALAEDYTDNLRRVAAAFAPALR